MKLAKLSLFLFFGGWALSLPVGAVSQNNFIPHGWKQGKQQQCEDKMFNLFLPKPEEVTVGRDYEILQDVARRFGKETPHLYLAQGDGNAEYVLGSIFDKDRDGRKGKIELYDLAMDKLTPLELKGAFAHAMGELVLDGGARYCEDFSYQPTLAEKADACAMAKVGKKPLESFLNHAQEMIDEGLPIAPPAEIKDRREHLDLEDTPDACTSPQAQNQ